MTPPRSDQGFVRMPDAEFEAMSGARRRERRQARARRCRPLMAEEAALDIRDLRVVGRLHPPCAPHRMQTAVRMITTGVMLALLAGVAIKLKIFGGGP